MTERRDQSPHGQMVRFWCDEYEKHAGAKYPFQGGKDGKTIQWLLGLYSAAQIESFISAFFVMDDEFIEASGHSLGVFRGCLPKVIQAVKRAQPKPDMRGHLPPCRTHAECLEKTLREARELRKSGA